MREKPWQFKTPKIFAATQVHHTTNLFCGEHSGTCYFLFKLIIMSLHRWFQWREHGRISSGTHALCCSKLLVKHLGYKRNMGSTHDACTRSHAGGCLVCLRYDPTGTLLATTTGSKRTVQNEILKYFVPSQLYYNFRFLGKVFALPTRPHGNCYLHHVAT